MSRLLFALVMAGSLSAADAMPGAELARILIDYPASETIFPPDLTAPTFQWRDEAAAAKVWRIEVAFGDGGADLRVSSKGPRMTVGEIDQRAISSTNELPKLSALEAVAHTWVPDAATWAAIRKRAVESGAAVRFVGLAAGVAVSRGEVRISVSRDPVGAPIFYRDVPLMPSETEKGVIKPLAAAAIPLINWRLKNVGEPGSRVLMTGLHSCANCHSFSRDGKTMGLDLDGPRNDKGMYALAKVAPQMSIGNEQVIEWSSKKGKLTGGIRVAFMSQVSPDGRYVVNTIEGPGGEAKGLANNYYVANFKDYRFLQVFFPTRGILAWFSKETGKLEPLPGADDPRYVHTNAVWSPDGKYLVFARAEARDAYEPGRALATRANDPNETKIQFDLYRIPFNEGKGGRAERVVGASENGRSNSFPKVSPDGRWIVFVECANGQLMRPDSELWIVPAGGGEARRLRSNMAPMNSWHSFSPNGRWLVFSSKSRGPYTKMCLTHLDEEGNASPAVLVEGATAANRAVNIPEFVNIPADGLVKIETPAVDYNRVYDEAWELGEKGKVTEAILGWRKALALNGKDPRGWTNLGAALAKAGKTGEAIENYRRALELKPDYAEAHNDLGIALAVQGKFLEAGGEYRRALELRPGWAEVYQNLGLALGAAGDSGGALEALEKAAGLGLASGELENNLGLALARAGRGREAGAHFARAVELDPKLVDAHVNLGMARAGEGKVDEAIAEYRRAVALEPGSGEARYNLGSALYFGKGDGAGALREFREILRGDPGQVVVMTLVVRILATSSVPSLRNGAEAVRLGEMANQGTGGREPAVLESLAMAYAEVGRFPEAVATAGRALALVEGRQGDDLRAEIRLYEGRRPVRGR